jgi:hypothetical protein
MAWRGAAVDRSSEDADATPGASPARNRQAATRPKRAVVKARAERQEGSRQEAQSESPASPAREDAGRSDALGRAEQTGRPERELVPADRMLAQVQAALDAGSVQPAISAFVAAQRTLGVDHSGLQALEPRLTELVQAEVRQLSDKGECERLDALAARLATTSIGRSSGLTRAAGECKPPADLAVDGGPSSAETQEM